MGLFRKGRNRSQSTRSVTPQPLLQDTDSDAFFLPGNDNVYLTHNKNGKPALGRKKPNNILQDLGFDILSQSFGIPSRKYYERRARSLSSASQSSGLIIAPATPQSSRGTQTPNASCRIYSYEDTESPKICRKTSSIRSSSTLTPATMVRNGHQHIPNSQQHNPHMPNSSFMGPQASNHHRIPPPPPPPPSAPSWHRYPTTNTGIAPVPMSYYGAAPLPTHTPGYSYSGAPMPQGGQNWANPQHYIVAQYPNALGTTVPQTSAMPMMPHHQHFSQYHPAQAPYMQVTPATCPPNIPPPPPPPQQNWHQPHAVTTRQGEMPRKGTNHASSAKKIAKQSSQVGNASRDAIRAHEKLRRSDDTKEYLSKRIRHVHVCAGCGKKRSTRYQKAHPLKRGEIPALNYCYSCLKDAADTDCDSSDGNMVNDPPFKKDCRKPTVPWPSSDEGYTTVDAVRTYKQSRRAKKSDRFGPLSRLFSRRAPSDSFPPPSSFSSAEESRSRASSLVSDVSTDNSVHTASVSRRRPDFNNNSNGLIQERAKTPALPQQRHSDVDLRNRKQKPPVVPAAKEPHQAGHEDNVYTTNNKKSALPRTRTRIPRPQPQSPIVDIDDPFSAAADELISDEERSSPFADTNATGLPPVSYLAGMGTPSEPSSQTIPNETRQTTRRINTQGDINKSVKKSVISSPNTANRTSSPNAARSSYIKASVNDYLKTPLAEAAKTGSKGNANQYTDHDVQGFYRTESQFPLDCSPDINPEQVTDLHPPPASEHSTRQPVRDYAPVVTDEPEPFFNYAEPVTPTDVPYADNIHPPYVVSDSWSDYQTDAERAAEEMAERDLAFASKLFDSLSGSLGGSATSTFPTTSFATGSNISIVSYYSDSDQSDHNNTTTPIIEEADAEDVVEGTGANKPIERIEFSSEEERQNSVRSKALAKPAIAYLEHQGGRMAELSPSRKKNMYKLQDDGQDDDAVDLIPSPIGSSLIGHTGHSVDELGGYALVQEEPASATKSCRLRRFLQLPSA